MDKKEKYLEAMEARMQEIKAKIEDLQDRLGKVGADARAELEKRLKELSDKQEAARQKLQELKGAGAEKMEALKTRAEKVWGDLEGAVGKVMSKFKK
jgi:chromosome segregation ATPase